MAILTHTKAKAIKAGDKPLLHGGVRNLSLVPSSSDNGVGSWVLRYKNTLTNKRAKVVLGRFPEMSIVQAADEARVRLELLARGFNVQHQPVQAETFESLVNAYRSFKLSTNSWADQTLTSFDFLMRKYALPYLAAVPLANVSQARVMDCVTKIWVTHQPTAKLLLGHLGAMFRWAEDMDLIEFNFIPRLTRTLGSSRQPKPPQHQPAMAWQDVPRFVQYCMDCPESRVKKKHQRLPHALVFIVLTVARTSAVRLLDFSELDLSSMLWTVEAFAPQRKSALTRVTPLPKQVQDLVSQSGEGLVFPVFSRGGFTVFSAATLSRMMRDVCDYLEIASDVRGRTPTLHGLRATFKSWADTHGYDDRLSELQLWHTLGNRVHQAYARDQLVEQRREMMQAWADYCFSLAK